MREFLQEYLAVIGGCAFLLAVYMRYRDVPSWYGERERGNDAREAWKIMFWGIVIFTDVLGFGLLMGLLGWLR